VAGENSRDGRPLFAYVFAIRHATTQGRAMTDQPENLTLIFLRRLDEKMNGLIEDGREIKQRLGMLEQQGASISRRVDRLDLRLERVERRLDIADADTRA
jgi:hypothetical protein